jgi:hypothetical protein
MNTLVVGIAAILSTLAGSYLAALLTGGSRDPEQKASVALEFIKLDVISVPVIRSGKIQGYVLVRASVGVPLDEAKNGRPVITVYSSEGVFRALHEEDFDFKALKPTEIARLADRATSLINARIGRGAVKSTAFESVNFVPQSEVRKPFSPRRGGADAG